MSRSPQNIKNRRATWVFLAPIANLALTKDINWEFRIEHVTFIAASHLPNRRKRFGIPNTISALRSQRHGIFDRFFSEGETFATLRRTGKGTKCEEEFLQLVQNELAILASSQLCYGRRRQNANPTIFYGHKPNILSYLLLDAGRGGWVQPNTAMPPFMNIVLDGIWEHFQKEAFFFRLLRVIRGQAQKQRGWREVLRRAAILIGQSQSSSDVVHSFLWSMIALEMLILEPGEKTQQSLQERPRALLGGSTEWQVKNYPTRITDLYEKRNRLMHQGKTDNISQSDLEFLDRLLYNLLINIVRHPTLFPTKRDLIKFSEDVMAAERLGGHRKVRPQTMMFYP